MLNQKAMTAGASLDVSQALEIVAKIERITGLAPSTIAMRACGDTRIVERLESGRITLRKLRKITDQLTRFLEKENQQ